MFNFKHGIKGEYEMMIYDGLGRIIHQLKNDQLNMAWDASQVEGGIYFYEVQYKNGGKHQGKLVISGR